MDNSLKQKNLGHLDLISFRKLKRHLSLHPELDGSFEIDTFLLHNKSFLLKNTLDNSFN